MKQLIAWLDRNGIPYRGTDSWALMFQGNHPDGIYIDREFADEIRRHARRNDGFRWEWRGHYTTLYCMPA